MGLLKFSVISLTALAIPATVALLPSTARADGSDGDSGGSSISDYGTSGAASTGLAAGLSTPISDGAAPASTPILTADGSSFADADSLETLSGVPVVAMGGGADPAIIPEPASASIMLVGGVAILMRRRRRSPA
jgi:hypothetical protein